MIAPTTSPDARSGTEWSHADYVRSRLLWGQEHARTIGQLADLSGLTRRQVEQALEELCSSGQYPIVAGAEGVWLTADVRELEAYADRLLQRARRQFRRVRGVRRCARSMRQPMTLFGDAA